MAKLVLASAVIALAIAGCGTDPPSGRDAGGGGGIDGGGGSDVDGGFGPDGAPLPRVDSGIDGGGACVPSVEICGDRMDQNCDGRDTSCGDTDGDGIMACRAGDDLTRCDCDDARTDVRPPFGSGTPGAPEICDMRDNDCNGRVDESAACCAGCASLGADRARADICTEAGECDCSTEPGTAPCAAGLTCCASGCTDTMSELGSCGSCNSMCTVEADRCTAGNCMCGSTAPCDAARTCVAGRCT